MHWKGYAGGIGEEGGALSWDSAMRLQWSQFVHKAVMAGVMPGQKTVVSVREIMELTP